MIAALQVLLVITAANAAPVLVSLIMGRRPAQPVDCGYRLADGQRLFGESKSFRGIAAAVAAAALTGLALGLPPAACALAGLLAMAGDLVSSFAKRRLALAPSSRFLGLDQGPEALLPLGALIPLAGLPPWGALMGALLFIVLGPPLSWLLFQAGIRGQPH